jgi:putative phosphoribosyl transferase
MVAGCRNRVGGHVSDRGGRDERAHIAVGAWVVREGAPVIFQNREEAGRRLAGELLQYRNDTAGLILALPRGGVAVGYQLSLALHLPLDVFITRKIGAPGNPEYALGAVAETGEVFLNDEAVGSFALSQHDLEWLIQTQKEEIDRRKTLYRQGQFLPALTDRTVLLVEDGIATGATFFASAAAIQKLNPKHLVGIVPVGPPETIRNARERVDELVVLLTPEPFYAVGDHYADFTQVKDSDVIEYLNLAEESRREWTERTHSSPA